MDVQATKIVSFDPTDITLQLYRESRRGAADFQTEPNCVPQHLRIHQITADHQRIALPAPVEQTKPLAQSLLERMAIRFYPPTPLSAAQLGTILKAAILGDQQDWPHEEEAGVGLQLMAVAWRVEGIEPAVYSYDPKSHELAYVGPAPDPKEATSLALQAEFAAAPVLIFVTGNLAAACERYGSWGHRQLLLRAGAAGLRLWLASIGVGLAGTVFAGFLPRAAHRFAGVDGYLQASLLAYSVGNLPYQATSGGSANSLSQQGKEKLKPNS